ncbi:succinyl-diaminopimelate desuccinylase [Moorella thermoacetica]|uniref:Succinyl-diaminopimelate desuccinylase n=1 Tax=Neomoorella thermoacetica TaxID=1525 RepID=A0A1J5JK43_NEOTH|nr:YgeY family selenium metabolism-linked hydrolase [Moorella thermoacetica]OIQ09894.1 succinyl-diaminopimelate desuccinylase [Moorella thermoacetica]
MLTEARRREVLELARQLLRIPSLSGKEKWVARAIRERMQELGYDEARIDSLGNVIGIIRGRRPGPCLLFDGHMDTVAATGEGWRHDPIGGEVQDGRLYGRGASDMKGALAAMVAAAGYFAHDRERDFAGTLAVAGTVHEECFEGVAAREVFQAVRPDYVVLGEASELNLKRGQRGRAEIVITTRGRAAHSSNPGAGNNAVYQMVEVVRRLRELEPPLHPVLGPGILELTDIISAPYPGASVVPDTCRVTYDRRLLVGETREGVLAPIRKVIDELAASCPGFRAEVAFARGEGKCYTGAHLASERFYPGWLLPDDHELVRRALAGLRAAGLQPALSHYSFCTNGSFYAGEAGVPTIGFGPSREELAHVVDEYIELEQLWAAATGYYALAGALLAP